MLDVSLAAAQAQACSQFRKIALATTGLTLVLFAGVGLHVRRTVLARLNRPGDGRS